LIGVFFQITNLEKVTNSKTNLEIDEFLAAKDAGCSSLDEFYALVESHKLVHKIRVPLVSINSDDDMFIDNSGIPYSEIEKTDSIIQINVAGGGHIEFFSGLQAENVANKITK